MTRRAVSASVVGGWLAGSAMKYKSCTTYQLYTRYVTAYQFNCFRVLSTRNLSAGFRYRDSPLFPLQFQYEVEDGYRTDDDAAVRIGHNEADFPEYSWRGYGTFSQLQDEVLLDIPVTSASVYNVILR